MDLKPQMEFIYLILSVTLLILFFIIKRFTYWQRKGISVPPFGCVKEAYRFKESFSQSSVNIYKYLKGKKMAHGGVYIFFRPVYVPVDLNIIKNILLKDFQYFMDRGAYSNEKDDPLSANLFGMRGKEWQNLRSKISPTFTAGKIKSMFNTLLSCTEDLENFVSNRVDTPINMKDACSKYTIDAIGRCIFGIECNCLLVQNNDFQRILGLVFKKTLPLQLRDLLIFHIPKVMKFFRVAKIGREITDFFMQIVAQTIVYREKHNIFRNDLMDLLMKLKICEQNGASPKITFKNIVSQVFLFFEAGYETSSTALTLALFELSRNEEIQEKLRREVRDVLAKCGNVLSFDAIQEMHYLDNVVNEILRKYPALYAISRVCTKDYVVPDTKLLVKKGTTVLIPVYGIHHDPEFYPDPERFDPDRFLEKNKSKRPACSNLSFGDGPRICIGLRFGMIQTKAGLAALINKYRFTFNEKTKLPLKFEPFTFITTIKGDVWLNVNTI